MCPLPHALSPYGILHCTLCLRCRLSLSRPLCDVPAVHLHPIPSISGAQMPRFFTSSVSPYFRNFPKSSPLHASCPVHSSQTPSSTNPCPLRSLYSPITLLCPKLRLFLLPPFHPQYRTQDCSMSFRRCGNLSIPVQPRSIGFGVTEL